MKVTLAVGQIFPVGTQVGAYAGLDPNHVPLGDALQTAPVAVNGELTFDELEPGGYVAAALVNEEWVKVRFDVAPDPEADPLLVAHEKETVEVHGIADTSALATKEDVEDEAAARAADVTAEENARIAHVAAHEVDKTNVHGIADMAQLALKSEIPPGLNVGEYGAGEEYEVEELVPDPEPGIWLVTLTIQLGELFTGTGEFVVNDHLGHQICAVNFTNFKSGGQIGILAFPVTFVSRGGFIVELAQNPGVGGSLYVNRIKLADLPGE